MAAISAYSALKGGGGASGGGLGGVAGGLTGGAEETNQSANTGAVTVNAGGFNLPMKGFFDEPDEVGGVPVWALGIGAMVALLAVLVLVKR